MIQTNARVPWLLAAASTTELSELDPQPRQLPVVASIPRACMMAKPPPPNGSIRCLTGKASMPAMTRRTPSNLNVPPRLGLANTNHCCGEMNTAWS